MQKKPKINFYFILAAITCFSCNSPYQPELKKRGYFRIPFPKHSYRIFSEPGYPYTFEYPVYGEVKKDSTFFEVKPENPWWLNVDLPQFSGRIHLSYKVIKNKNNYDSLVNDAYKMSYKQHTYKASARDEFSINTPNKVGGVYFKLSGNTATTYQFYLTDTSKHFLRGALYFYATPNEDSLAIVNDFVNKDLQHLINTLQWR